MAHPEATFERFPTPQEVDAERYGSVVAAARHTVRLAMVSSPGEDGWQVAPSDRIVSSDLPDDRWEQIRLEAVESGWDIERDNYRVKVRPRRG